MSGLTLAFTTDGQYGGDDGCNRLSGRLVTAPPRVLALGEPGRTALACSKPVMELAARYAAALALVADYRLTAGELHLLDQAGGVLLTLVPDSNEGTTVGPPLAGTTWRLVAVRGTPLPSRQPSGVIVEVLKQHIAVDHCGLVTIYREGPDRTLEMVESEYIPVGLPCDVVLGPGRRIDLMEPLTAVIAYERTGNRLQLLGLAGEALLTLEQAR